MKILLKYSSLIVLFLSLSMPSLAYTLEEKLDYCSTIESWAAHSILDTEKRHYPELDIQKATSQLISRNEIKENNKPILLGDWGDLYIQIIRVTIPYQGNKKVAKIIIATSIISSEECSLSRPSFVDVSELDLYSSSFKMQLDGNETHPQDVMLVDTPAWGTGFHETH